MNTITICPYGSNCYRKNKIHFENFKHPTMLDLLPIEIENLIYSFNLDIGRDFWELEKKIRRIDTDIYLNDINIERINKQISKSKSEKMIVKHNKNLNKRLTENKRLKNIKPTYEKQWSNIHKKYEGQTIIFEFDSSSGSHITRYYHCEKI